MASARGTRSLDIPSTSENVSDSSSTFAPAKVAKTPGRHQNPIESRSTSRPRRKDSRRSVRFIFSIGIKRTKLPPLLGRQLTGFIGFADARSRWLRSKLSPITYNLQTICRKAWAPIEPHYRELKEYLDPRNYEGTQRIVRSIGLVVMSAIIAFSAILPLVQAYLDHIRYRLDDQAVSLIGEADPDLAKKITFDTETQSYYFNKDGIKSDDTDPATKLKAMTGGAGKDSKSLYSVKMPTDPTKGITYYDNNLQVSFTLVPELGLMANKEVKDRLLYPGADGIKDVFTAKNNGLKDDIVLTKNIGDGVSYAYKLNLPSGLQARMLEDGSLGIYSADTSLYGNISYGSDKDHKLIDEARKNAKKDHLVFVLPPPTIKQYDAITKQAVAASASAHFVLSKDGKKLWVNADGLSKLNYPLTIDPSVVVTSTSDFTSGNDDSNIDYPANQINRGALTGGTMTLTTSTGTSGSLGIYAHVALAYNGYMYAVGGTDGSTTFDTVRYVAINSNGTLGTWSTTTNMPDGRRYMAGAIYNGYMYILGGISTGSGSAVRYALLQSNGTIATDSGCGQAWCTSSNSLPAGAGTQEQVATVYNGYIYNLGGMTSTVYYAPLNADGSVGSWTAASSFTNDRYEFSGGAYNGYMYIYGGTSGSGVRTDAQYAPINSDGSLGTWVATTSPPSLTGISWMAFGIYNGYVYAAGGLNSSGQYMSSAILAPILANGQLGTWETINNAFSATTAYQKGVVYNGYFYSLGGVNSSFVPQNVAYYGKIDTAGTPVLYNTTTAFAAENEDTSAVVYNGYIYAVGRYANGTNTFAGTTQYAPINANGTIGSWTATQTIPASNADISAFAYNGFLYAVGGQNSTGFPQTNVYYASINISTGALSSVWTATNALPTATRAYSFHNAVVANGYVYVGATNSTQLESALICTGSNSGVGGCTATAGTVGTWNTYTTGGVFSGLVVYGNYIYSGGGGGSGSDIYYALVCTSSNSGVGGCAGTPGTVGTWTDAGAGTSGYMPLAGYNGLLYAANGSWTYANATIATSGALGTLQTTGRPTNYNQSGVTAYDGYMYFLGGYNSASNNENDYVPLNNGGTGNASTWTSTSSLLGGGRYELGSVAYNGYLYAIGGNNGSSFFGDVQFASINATGTIGSWHYTHNSTDDNTTFVAGFNTSRQGHQVVAYNGYLYILGGNGTASSGDCNSNSYCNGVQFAPINANGTVGAWHFTHSSTDDNTTFVAGFTNGRYNFTSVAYNGYLYVIGGHYFNGSQVDLGDVQYAPINSNGTIGAWTATTSLPALRTGHSSVVYNGYLYVLGGGAASTTYNDVQYALICTGSNNGVGGCGATAGTVGTWTNTTGFDIARSGLTSVAMNGRMYIFNGQSPGRGDMQYTPISSNGGLGKWENGTDTGGTSYIYGQGVAAYNGFVYLVGGLAGAGYSNTTTYAGIGSNQMEGSFSKLINFGSSTNKVTSITYNGVLPNGLNNIFYETAGSNGIFGSAQSAGAAPPAGGYTKQYAWVSIVMDDSNTGTFPDSTTTSANVTDFTVNYATNSAPASPTLIAPTAAHAALQPTFQLRTTDGDNDYLQYKIDVCSDNLCNTILHTIDQSSSQTGWSGQNQAGGTAYTGSSVLTSSTIANYAYQFSDLAQGTTYYWRGAATDPNGTTNWGPSSSIQSFTTLGIISTPTTIAPVNNSTGASVTPQFQLRSSDGSGADYARYKVVLCTNAAMTTGCQTFDQTASQTGWSGQDSQASTAYVTSSTLTSSTIAHYTVQSALSYGTQYYWQGYGIDPGDSNTWSAASSVQTFTTSFQPGAPTLITPIGSGALLSPLFQMAATDGDGDYVKYKIDLCSTSNCSSIITTIDQNSSQTGWQDQDQQSATAYSSGRTARYQWQGTNLTPNTQYWWRAAAKDPAGTNTFGSYSSIGTFTTGQVQSVLRGGSVIRGGSIVQ